MKRPMKIQNMKNSKGQNGGQRKSWIKTSKLIEKGKSRQRWGKPGEEVRKHCYSQTKNNSFEDPL